MKIKASLFFLVLIALLSGCSIFKPGCHCPKVSYNHSFPHKSNNNS